MKISELYENEQKSIFRTGMCDVMAIALHRKTFYPLGLWRGYFPDEFGDEGDEAYEDVHAVVVKDFEREVWVDVDGVHRGVPENLYFTTPVTRVELVPATVEEVMYAFGNPDEGHIDEYTKRANTLIDSDPVLSKIVQ